MTEYIKVMILAVVFGAIAGGGVTYFLERQRITDSDKLIKEFYAVENAVHVSPHSLRTAMSRGEADNFVLVDLRSQEEYEHEHIVGAINIPAYSNPNKSAYGDRERIVNAFRALPKDKEVIVYCYSIPCMTGRKIGKMLTEEDMYVKHLGIGWNEWRYFWNLWNHDGEIPTVVQYYIARGSEPGEVDQKEVARFGESCPIGGAFGC